MLLGLSAGTIDISNTVAMTQAGSVTPAGQIAPDYSNVIGLSQNCQPGGVDPITGDTIVSCGGMGPVLVGSNQPTCMPGDVLTYQNGNWICASPGGTSFPWTIAVAVGGLLLLLSMRK